MVCLINGYTSYFLRPVFFEDSSFTLTQILLWSEERFVIINKVWSYGTCCGCMFNAFVSGRVFQGDWSVWRLCECFGADERSAQRTGWVGQEGERSGRPHPVQHQSAARAHWKQRQPTISFQPRACVFSTLYAHASLCVSDWISQINVYAIELLILNLRPHLDMWHIRTFGPYRACRSRQWLQSKLLLRPSWRCQRCLR